MSMPVFVAYLALLVLGAIPAFTFPIYYVVKGQWRRLPRGPERETSGHVLMFSTLFALLYVRGTINVSTGAGRQSLLHQSPGAAGFLLLLAALAAFVSWQRLWLFHKGRKEHS